MEIYGWVMIGAIVVSIILSILTGITFKGKPILATKNPKKTTIMWLFVGQIAIITFLLPAFINYFFWAMLLIIYTIVLAIITTGSAGL